MPGSQKQQMFWIHLDEYVFARLNIYQISLGKPSSMITFYKYYQSSFFLLPGAIQVLGKFRMPLYLIGNLLINQKQVQIHGVL